MNALIIASHSAKKKLVLVIILSLIQLLYKKTLFIIMKRNLMYFEDIGFSYEFRPVLKLIHEFKIL